MPGHPQIVRIMPPKGAQAVKKIRLFFLYLIFELCRSCDSFRMSGVESRISDQCGKKSHDCYPITMCRYLAGRLGPRIVASNRARRSSRCQFRSYRVDPFSPEVQVLSWIGSRTAIALGLPNVNRQAGRSFGPSADLARPAWSHDNPLDRSKVVRESQFVVGPCTRQYSTCSAERKRFQNVCMVDAAIDQWQRRPGFAFAANVGKPATHA